MTFRVMAVQEEGSEILIRSGIATVSQADRVMSEARNDHPEFRSFWTEREIDYNQMLEEDTYDLY